MAESCMFWGVEVGDGWYDLIDALCESFSSTYSTSIGLAPEEVEEYGERYQDYDKTTQLPAGPVVAHDYFSIDPPQVVADQVKEKFGSLRFYYHLEFDPKLLKLAETNKDAKDVIDRYSAYYDGVTHHAETYSLRTCEITGKPGTLGATGKDGRGGWWSVRCQEQADLEGRGWRSVAAMKAEKSSEEESTNNATTTDA